MAANSMPVPAPAATDGTSQAARLRPELDPAYAVLDSRSSTDLLAFARAFAAELVFVDDNNQPQGDWSGLLPDGEGLLAAADYLRMPERFSAELAAPFARPQVALLLACIQLLGHARDQTNGLTRRHLDFYYREVLRMVRKPAVPDQVHVLLAPDARTQRLLLPAGTLLRAGKTSAGQDRHYRTVADALLSPVQVAQLRSLRVDVRNTGIGAASRQYLDRGTRQDAFVAMLRIALGSPAPGDALPLPLLPGLPPAAPAGQPPNPVDWPTLLQAQKIAGFVASGLAMPLLDDFRALMRLRDSRLGADAADWARINTILLQAGRARDPNFQLQPQALADFNANLRSALGLTDAQFARLYDRLPEVASADDAYAVLDGRPDVQAFVLAELRLPLADFKAMMQTKAVLDGEWAQITGLIESAGQRRNPLFVLPPALRQARQIDSMLAAALGPLAWPWEPAGRQGLDGLNDALLGIARYFSMSAERFLFIMAVSQRSLALPDSVAPEGADWQQVWAICTDAYRESVYRRRREALLALAVAAPPASPAPPADPARALADMLALALGEALDLPTALQRLPALGVGAADLQALTRLQGNPSGSGPATVADWARAAEVLEIAQRNRDGGVPDAPTQALWHHLYPAADARLVRPPGQAADAVQPRWYPFGSLPAAAAADPPPAPTEVLGWAVAAPLLALAEGLRTVVLTLGLDGDAARFDADVLRRLLLQEGGTGGGTSGGTGAGATTIATSNPFHLQLSGPAGWVEPVAVQLAWAGGTVAPFKGYPAVPNTSTSGLKALVFTLSLSDQQPAIVPPSLALHGLVASAPVLRLMLRPVWDAQANCLHSAYQPLRRLRLQRLRLAVSVVGLAGLALRNDQTVLDAKKPFEPFGNNPASGARLQLGHPELVGKAIDSISFRYSWLGAPAVLASHYANYPDAARADSFSARMGLRDGLLFAAVPKPVPLFDANTAAPVQRDLASPPDPGLPLPGLANAADPADPATWRRSWVWELAGDFQHAAYPALALQKSMAMAAEIGKGNKPDAAPFVVNPPYTPKLKSLLVDYSASVEQAVLARSLNGTDSGSALVLHHIHPFGSQPLLAGGAVDAGVDAAAGVDADAGAGAGVDQTGSVPLLPAYDAEGALYIGLSGLAALTGAAGGAGAAGAAGAASQRLSLLFQVAEGTADPDADAPAPQWSILSADRWRSLHDGLFEGSVLADATRGLINAGIVQLQLPAVQPSTLMPQASAADGGAALVWLCLRQARATAGVCDLVAVHPNAALAVQAVAAAPAEPAAAAGAAAPASDAAADPSSSPAPGPLPPDQITGTLDPVRGLASVAQPYSAFGGRPAEADAGFNTRVSERLRHRQRAVTAWDIERLVLDAFPQLYKAKCLSNDALLDAADGAAGTDTGTADPTATSLPPEPGRIDLVLVPNITRRVPADPFAPKASADLLRDVADFLADKLPPFARLQVKNASFVALKVRCGVRFMPGTDEGFCRQRLTQDLNRFLSPWAYDDGADLVIGGAVYANSIINFIEQRDYVDFIAGLRLFTSDGGRFRLVPEGTGYHASAQRPDAVLVAAATHEFDVIAANDFRVQAFGGIGSMRIELDFAVA